MCEHQSLTAVIVALLALAGTLGTGIIVWVVDRWQQRLNLVSAFAGELRAILTVVEERKVLQTLQRVVDDIQRLHQPRFIPFWIGDMHDVVFRQNADKLGSLRAPLPEQIVAAYYRIGSVVLELQMLFEASQGRGAWLGEQWRTDWQACLQQHQHTLTLANEARAFAADVINTLEHRNRTAMMDE